jgi:hypothetical protein
MPSEDVEEDVVEHPGIKPMWLLRFFTSWGARWGSGALSRDGNDNGDAAKGNGNGNGNGTAVEDPSSIGDN